MTKKPDCERCADKGYIIVTRLHTRHAVKKGIWGWCDVALGLELCPNCAIDKAIAGLQETEDTERRIIQ